MAFTPGDYCGRGRSDAGEKAGSDAKQDGWPSPSSRAAAGLRPLGFGAAALLASRAKAGGPGMTRTCNQTVMSAVPCRKISIELFPIKIVRVRSRDFNWWGQQAPKRGRFPLATCLHQSGRPHTFGFMSSRLMMPEWNWIDLA